MEIRTPIGTKLVFEKWSERQREGDGTSGIGTEEYVAINLVYQTVDQLQGRTLLSVEVPPMVLPVTVEGLTANSDGLYRLADFDARMLETMAEYEAIEDVVTEVPAATITVPVRSIPPYTLNGIQSTDSTRGVVIEQGQKAVRR